MATTSALVEGSAPSAVAERSPLDMPVGSAAQSGGVPGSQLRGPGGSHDHPARGQRRRRAGIVGGHRAGVSQVRSALLTIPSSELVNQPGVALCHAAALVVLRRARRTGLALRQLPGVRAGRQRRRIPCRSRSNEPAFAGSPQHAPRDQAAEDLFARRPINSPQSLRLRQSDAQARHLRVFGLYWFDERASRSASCPDLVTHIRYCHCRCS
jgi:hypothetical protein